MPTRQAVLARLRLRHLQCLLAVAECRNLKRAAEVLAVTQPAVTKTLNELEALLGLRLVQRGRRGALPTAEAEPFLRHARACLNALGQAVDSVLPGAAEAPLRVGALPTLAPSLLPAVALAWREARPQAELRVVTGLNRELLQALRARELDVVVGRLSEPEDMLGLTFELLFAEPLVIVVRSGHPLLQQRRLAAERLGEQAWVLPSSGTSIRHAADSFLRTRGVVPSAGITETVSSSLARALALDTGALWFAPLTAVEPDLAGGALQRLPLSTAGSEEPVGLLLRADEPPTPGGQAFVAALRGAAARRRDAQA